MSFSSVSTLSLSNSLLNPIQKAQARLSSLGVELSTGEFADLGLQLGAQAGQEISLKNQLTVMGSLTAANAIALASVKSAQDAIGVINTGAGNTLDQLATWVAGTGSSNTLQTLGENALQSLTAAANTTANGTYVFGGLNSTTQPMIGSFDDPTSTSAIAVGQAFQNFFGFAATDPKSSLITASDFQTFLDGPCSALFQGQNWSSLWSNASDMNTSQEIAPGETITTSVNANSSGFHQLTQAYVMLSAFGGTGLSPAAQQILVSRASQLVSKGSTALTLADASLGNMEAQITAANSSMGVQANIIQRQIGKMDNVDANTVATQLTALQTQLQMAYSLTSRLHDLNLAQYLPVA